MVGGILEVKDAVETPHRLRCSCLNITAMGFDDGEADGKPQTDATLCAFRVNAEKLVKNRFLQALGDTRPEVRYGN